MVTTYVGFVSELTYSPALSSHCFELHKIQGSLESYFIRIDCTLKKIGVLFLKKHGMHIC